MKVYMITYEFPYEGNSLIGIVSSMANALDIIKVKYPAATPCDDNNNDHYASFFANSNRYDEVIVTARSSASAGLPV